MCFRCYFFHVTKLAEIEAAIAQLPPEDWVEIRRWMDAQSKGTGLAPSSVDWSQSAAVTRERPLQERVAGDAVMEVLREARE